MARRFMFPLNSVRIWRRYAGVWLGVVAVLTACGRKPADPEAYTEHFRAEEVSFAALKGWREGTQGDAVAAFVRSCQKLGDAGPVNPVEALGVKASHRAFSGDAGAWSPPCAEAEALLATKTAQTTAAPSEFHRAARAFFERAFTPYQISAKRIGADGRDLGNATEGLFTAYFEPVYLAARAPSKRFSAPVRRRPADLVMVDLGQFRPDLAGERIAGSVRGGRLTPYPDHAAINQGAIDDRSDIIAWMTPTDLLFMQIQGSGRLVFDDEDGLSDENHLRQEEGAPSSLRVGYDGQNGHPYTPIGRFLIESGAVPREHMSMAAIRRWLAAASPEAARELREKNASYVFFRPLNNLPSPDLGPLGAQSVQLTPMRSLAVDRRYHALGAPIWVSVNAPEKVDKEAGVGARAHPLRRLFIAQDTGGAIRGPVRGDLYVGGGDEAGRFAGGFNRRGAMIVLLPKGVVPAPEKSVGR